MYSSKVVEQIDQLRIRPLMTHPYSTGYRVQTLVKSSMGQSRKPWCIIRSNKMEWRRYMDKVKLDYIMNSHLESNLYGTI